MLLNMISEFMDPTHRKVFRPGRVKEEGEGEVEEEGEGEGEDGEGIERRGEEGGTKGKKKRKRDAVNGLTWNGMNQIRCDIILCNLMR